MNPIPSTSKRFINSSALKRSSCDQQFAYTCCDGLINKENIEYLVFGTAVHKFCEMFKRLQCINPEAMFIELASEAQVPARKFYEENDGEDIKLLTSTIMQYDQVEHQMGLPLEVAGKPMVENYFEFPYKGLTPAGTVDFIGFDGRVISMYDYKTSRKWQQEALLTEYENSTQFPFYVNMIHRFPEQFCTDEGFCQAAREGQIDVRIVAVFVNVGQNMPLPKWRIGPRIRYTRALLDDYWKLFELYIPAIHNVYELGHGMRNGWISDLCRTCSFSRLCHEPDPEMALAIKNNLFVQKPYNPKHD